MKYIKYDKNALKEMRMFLLLWSTQALSGLGSAMTAYALVIWSYTQKGSALTTALLMVSSYAPYVIFSIFAGALSDKWNKKATMMVCDAAAAFTTVVMLILLRNDALMIWHLYALNAVNGLMNTVQQPASEVATTRILPKKYYQRVGGLRYLAGSLTSIMTPVIATAVMGIGGMEAVAAVDLCSFGIAFLALLFLIRIPEKEERAENEEKLLCAVRKGVGYLKKERGVSGNDAVAVRRKRNGARTCQCGYRHSHVCGEPSGFSDENAGKPCSCHMQQSAFFHEYGKFSAGVRKNSPGLVHWRFSRLDCHTAYECESGRGHTAENAGRNAGARIFRQKFPAVFYDSDRVSARRILGGFGI